MNVLVMCERSGAVRDAFRARGHEAWSNDLEYDTDTGELVKVGGLWPEYHLVGDGRTYFTWREWDLIVAHPPCTYLSNSSNKHMYNGLTLEGGINPERWADMCSAASFFVDCWTAPAERVCVENPVMHGHGMKFIRELLDLIGGFPDPFKLRQFVHPHMFGTKETKQTGLSLRNLPKLKATDNVKRETYELPERIRHRVHHMPPSKDRKEKRSATDIGLADAMGIQWGVLA